MTKGIYTVLENRALTADVYLMRLAGDTSALTNPGQFINIAIEFFKELTLSNIVVSTIILFVLSILAAIISQKLIEVPAASKLLKKKN